MLRLPLCAALVLQALSARGERLESIYREGAVHAFAHVETFEMELESMSMTLNGVELPPEALEEAGVVMPPMNEETRIRTRDELLAVTDGRPTRVRRTFEELREHAEGEDGGDKTGPLEGRTLVLEEEEGEVTATLEGDGEAVDESFLAHHRLARDTDLLLPDEPVEVGASWTLDDETLQRFLELDEGALLFEPDGDEGEGEQGDLFEQIVKEGSFGGEAELLALEERDGLRCAVIAFVVQVEAETEDLASLGMEFEEGMPGATGLITVQVEFRGKLWHALAEGRPVELEQTREGKLDVRLEFEGEAEGRSMKLQTRITARIEGKVTSAWTVPD